MQATASLNKARRKSALVSRSALTVSLNLLVFVIRFLLLFVAFVLLPRSLRCLDIRLLPPFTAA